MDIFSALFMELFCSIHMSVFVLQPLAEIRQPNNKKEEFWKYFKIRAVILLIGNLIFPSICILDFFAIFVGAFLVIPYMTIDKKSSKKISSVSIPKVKTTRVFVDLDDKTLTRNGILDPEGFKDELFDLFVSYEEAYSNFGYNTLNNICTNKYFHVVSNELSALERLKQKRIIENFSKNDVKIDHIYNNGHIQRVSALIDASFYDYTIDEKGSFIKGNKYSLKNRKFNVVFIKDIKDIISQTNCPNCGAPLGNSKFECEYCKSTVNKKMLWKIDSISKIVDTRVSANDNPIKMH